MEYKADAVVIGAGPAGLMAAGVCAARGRRVLLLEKNAVTGRKLRITGKGRCNVTNDCAAREVMDAVPQNGKFLFSVLSQFEPADTMRFFEGLGVRLKVERGRRVFPASDSAAEIADALERFAAGQGAQLRQAAVQAVLVKEGRVCGVRTKDGVIEAPSVLIACGGASYPGTGSNGDGARLAKALGHTIHPLTPSLIPLVENGEFCGRMQGLSLRNCGVRVLDRDRQKRIYEDFGELLFTHFGLSGPTILSASAHMRDMRTDRYEIQLDLKPALDEKKLDERILRDFSEQKNRAFRNSLDALLPQKMIPVVVERSGIPAEKRCNSVTREERQRLGRLLKCFSIDIKGFRPINEAVVTAGGVSVKEISPKTMESKLIAGLYFAGEVMDVDAYTGGFNLQIAFATGRLAGSFL